MVIVTNILAATTSANTWIKVAKEHLESGPRQMCMDVAHSRPSLFITSCQADCSSNPCHFLLSLMWFYRPHYQLIVPLTYPGLSALATWNLPIPIIFFDVQLKHYGFFWICRVCSLKCEQFTVLWYLPLHHHFLALKKVTFKFWGGIDASVIQCVECIKLSQNATWWWNSGTRCSQLHLGILYFLSLF